MLFFLLGSIFVAFFCRTFVLAFSFILACCAFAAGLDFGGTLPPVTLGGFLTFDDVDALIALARGFFFALLFDLGLSSSEEYKVDAFGGDFCGLFAGGGFDFDLLGGVLVSALFLGTFFIGADFFDDC